MGTLFRKGSFINETKPDGTVVTRFTPIAPYDTPDAVERLCMAYEQAIASEKVDSLILIPVFICDFLCIHPFNDAHVIIGTRLEKPSKINGFALLSPIFLSHAGWREDGAVHINTYYTESQMGLCA